MILVKDLNFVNGNTIMLVKFGGYQVAYEITATKINALKTWLGTAGKPHMEFWTYLEAQDIPEVMNQPDTIAEDAETTLNYFETVTGTDGIRVTKPRA